MDSNALLSIGEVAEALDVSVSQIRKLTNAGRITATTTAGGHRRYDLAAVKRQLERRSPIFDTSFDLTGLQEHLVWRDFERTLSSSVTEQARRILGYSITEMVNNAIDHSGGERVRLTAFADDARIEITVADDGVGVFDRMMGGLALPDRFAAIQELSKGKATTAPANHTGQGIFFTSRGVDRFSLEANGLVWIVDNRIADTTVGKAGHTGTEVRLELDLPTRRSMRAVFDEFTIDDEFARTRPAVKLLEYGTDLISRSEAKRLASRLEQFEEVELDFGGVDVVGQGFVDELLRVWATDHPGTRLIPINMNEEVGFMVRRGLGGRSPA
jgi:excisionase family DNA binding protein